MPKPRLFEFHEQPWVPAFIRDCVVECLYHIMRQRRMLAGLIEPLSTFLDRTGADRLLDLCSGAGGVALILAEEFARRQANPPQIVLSDLFPRIDVWEEVQSELDVRVGYRPESVNATAVPEELSRGCPRMMSNAFHHFPPERARAILADAVAHSPGIFISEAFPPGLRGFLSMLWPKPWVVAAFPWLSTTHKLKKLFWTLGVPVIPAAITFDGAVSALRMYREQELRELAAPLGDQFEWVYGTCPYGRLGEVTYFYGVRQ